MLPDEHEAEEIFRKTHEDWAVHESTGMRTYKQTMYAEPKEAKVVEVE